MRFKIANWCNGVVVTETDDEKQAMNTRDGLGADDYGVFVIPRDEQHLYSVGDELPKSLLVSCEIEELRETLGYIP